MAKKQVLKDTNDGGPLGGERLAKNIRKGEEQRDSKAERYGRNRANYLGDPPARVNPPEDGAADCHYPIVQPIGDALSSWIVGTVTSIEPYCIPVFEDEPAPVSGQEEQEEENPALIVQKEVGKRLKKANLRDALKKVSQPACWANAGVIWVSWAGENVRLDVIPPKRFVVYPSCRGIADSLLYGRSFDRTRGEIRALAKKENELVDEDGKLKKERYYFNDPDEQGRDVDALVDSLTPDSSGGPSFKEAIDHPGMTEVVPHQTAVYSEDDLIELHECVVRNAEDGSTWIVTVHADSGTLLKKSPYPWRTQCAFVFRFKTECTDEFWHEGSVAQDLQGIQRDVNEALNAYMDAIGMASYGAAFVPKGTLGQSKVVRYGRGSMTEVTDPTRMQIFSPAVQAAGCIELVQFLDNKAQAVARMSAMGQGGPLKNSGGDTTKFEAEQAMAGQNTGVEDYVENFGTDLPLLFAHSQELIDAFADLSPEVKTAMHQECEWSVQVTSPSGTPAMQARSIYGLFEMAQNPETRIRVHETASRYLEFLERQGVTDATGLQLPEDPVLAVSQILQVPPELVSAMLQDLSAQVAALEASQPGNGQGMAPKPGGGALSLLGGGEAPSGVGVA